MYFYQGALTGSVPLEKITCKSMKNSATNSVLLVTLPLSPTPVSGFSVIARCLCSQAAQAVNIFKVVQALEAVAEVLRVSVRVFPG